MAEYTPPTATRSGPKRKVRAVGDARNHQSPHRLETAWEWLHSGGSVLLFGPIGVGKSAALDMLTRAVGGARILRCAPGALDADRAYRALAELLSTVTASELGRLPAERRRVLMGAFGHRTDGCLHSPSAAVRLAALNLLRTTARSRPLLLVVDNLHWMDRASADVLRFVASRVGDLAIQMVAAEQVPAGGVPAGRRQCPAPLLMTQPDPLPAAEPYGRRRQGGKGAPWAVCRRWTEPVA